MQIEARYQAVCELLGDIFRDLRPADHILNEYFRARKYIGSKDRRFISQTVWDVIRQRRRLEYATRSTDVRQMFLLFLKNTDQPLPYADLPYGMSSVTSSEEKKLAGFVWKNFPEDVSAECPLWLYEKIQNPILVSALNETAPADLRVNMEERSFVKQKLRGEELFFSETPLSPYGLRSEERVNLNNCRTYREGFVEVQDESCQIGALLCAVRPDEKTIDYCAGAGGKSLAISAYNHNDGLIEAYDKNWNRMDVIKERASRLSVRNIRLVTNVTDRDYDCFIVDAPCSGSGTWRRSPDSKFRLTAEKLSELNQTQAELLNYAYRHIRSGGRVIYMTCSVLADENERIVEAFANEHPDVFFADHAELWTRFLDKPYPFNETRYIRFSPHTTHTDGFFFCTLYKK